MVEKEYMRRYLRENYVHMRVRKETWNTLNQLSYRAEKLGVQAHKTELMDLAVKLLKYIVENEKLLTTVIKHLVDTDRKLAHKLLLLS